MFALYLSKIEGVDDEYRFNYEKIETEHLTLFIEEKKSDIDIIYFSGNDQSINDFKSKLQILQKSEFNIILPVYRGYLNSKGSTNELEIMIQVHHLSEMIKKRKTRVYVIGYSFGSAVALYFNKIFNDVIKIMLVSSFYSVERVITERYKFSILFKYLITEKYENDKRIIDCKNKVLFVVGGSDTNIEFTNTKDLHAIYIKHQNVKTDEDLIIFPKSSHTNLIAPYNDEFIVLFKKFFMI